MADKTLMDPKDVLLQSVPSYLAGLKYDRKLVANILTEEEIKKIEADDTNSGRIVQMICIMKNKTAKVIDTFTQFVREHGVTIGDDVKVEVHTSSEYKSGTNSTISIQLTGDGGTSTRYILDKKFHDDFVRGQMDNYTVYLKEDIGKTVTQITMFTNNKGPSPAWKFDKIIVSYKKTAYDFEYHNWLPTPGGDWSVSLTPS